MIRSISKDYIPDDVKYEETFDIFEYILSLLYCDLVQGSGSLPGRFGWRYKRSQKFLPSEFIKNGIKLGDNWNFLKSGFFNGSADHLSKIVEEYDSRLKEVTRGWH